MTKNWRGFLTLEIARNANSCRLYLIVSLPVSRTTLVDNNTWNNSHIALVGKAMSSNESAAYEIMTELNVDYVLVIFGGVIGKKFN